MKLKLNPTQQITFVLTLFALGAIVSNNFKMAILIHFLATVGFSLFLFFVFKFLSKKQKNISNTVISSLIIFLLLHYINTTGSSSFLPALIVTFVTIFYKFFLEWKGAPIFNPVAFGFLILFLISKVIPGIDTPFISWWGASYQLFELPFTLILIALWIIFWFKNWRKWYLFFTYLTATAIIIAIFYIPDPTTNAGRFDFLKFTFSHSTIYFLTSIMLAEPRTSPILKSQQVIYGLIAAVFYTSQIFFGIPGSVILGLLAPNLYFFITKWLMIRKMQGARANTGSQSIETLKDC